MISKTEELFFKSKHSSIKFKKYFRVYDLLFSNHIPNLGENEIYDKEILKEYFTTDFLPD